MIKLFSPSDWDMGLAVAEMVKVASGGLHGHDRQMFLKRASHVFLPYVDDIKLHPGEVPVHLIALGATERWGFNRNGDGFKAATCRDRCHTFEKLARFYRDHANKDPNKSYGRVIKAAFNEEMMRIELLGGLNGTKEAAARNGGLVADRECEKLARGENIMDSMSCKIAYDVCSYCGNKAKHRGEYCTAKTCKAGGCRDNLGRVVKVAGRVHQLGVDNPAEGLDWFDISDISTRQADRTALGTTADWLKAANVHGAVIGGAALAEAAGVTGPWTDSLAGMYKLAAGLAAAEAAGHSRSPALLRAFDSEIFSKLGLSPTDPQLGEKLAALADVGVFVGPEEFAMLVGRPNESARGVGAFAKLASAANFPGLMSLCPLDVTQFEPKTADCAYAATKVAFACTPSAMEYRAARSVVSGRPAPEPHADSATPLGVLYAAYKTAALWRYASTGGQFPLTARAALAQNL